MAAKANTHIFFMSLFLILSLSGCRQPDIEDKGLGFIPPPAMLYKSFRAVSPQANAGAAPEPAENVDLSALFPVPGDQGEIGSCTAWTTAYACKSFHENAERNWDVNAAEHRFSPSFIYNQINGGVDQGASLESAIAVVINTGCASLTTMPYTDDYRRRPTAEAFAEAAGYKAKSFARIEPTDLDAVKQVLAGGNAVLIGMMLSENFYDYREGVYRETSGISIGGHAMCVVGYDNNRRAFKIINSWGTYWGQQGYLWLDYELFKRDVVTALVMYDEVITRPESAAPPVEVEASRGSYPDRIKVVWQSAANATSYLVYRSTEPAAYFSLSGETRGSVYLDAGVAPGEVFYYAVKSVGRSGESAFSESSGGYAGSLVTEPGVPQELTGTVSAGKVYLKWNPVNAVDGYYVYRFDPPSGNYLQAGVTSDDSFRHEGSFSNGETLWYLVTAYKGDHEGQASRPLALTVELELKTLKAPHKLQASRGSFPDRIEVSWKAVSGATGYRFYKYYVGEEKWKRITELSTTNYTDTETEPLEAYYIVTATAGSIVSGPSEPVWGWIKGFGSPPLPKKYADAAYYNDDNYFEDEDFTDETRYLDDRTAADHNTGGVYDKFSDEVTRKTDKTEKIEKEKDLKDILKEKERAADDKFLNDQTALSTTAEVLDKVRGNSGSAGSSNGKTTNPASGKDNKAAALVKKEMSGDESDFFGDDSDFFSDDADTESFFNDEMEAEFFKDEDDDFF